MTRVIKSKCPILISNYLTEDLTWLPKKNYSQMVIITDHRVKKLYGLPLLSLLKKKGYKAFLLFFPAGEKSKNYETKQKIEKAMHLHHCDRDTLILALGGGVVGDLAGFIAATFLRGVDYIQIPTTLLAMVDSSIGGKSGINTQYGKNLIGSIYQPKCIVIDPIQLKTLPKKQMINGLIEAIKMFLTHDKKSFQYVENHLQLNDEMFLNEVVTRAIKIKAGVVIRDEKDQGERSLLNFGHTIGHALEKVTDYQIMHGYAVANGILLESTISHLSGLLDEDALHQIKKIFSRLKIHGQFSHPITKIIQATKYDKKVKNGEINYVLLHKIGRVHVEKNRYVHPVTDDMVRQAYEHLGG